MLPFFTCPIMSPNTVVVYKRNNKTPSQWFVAFIVITLTLYDADIHLDSLYLEIGKKETKKHSLFVNHSGTFLVLMVRVPDPQHWLPPSRLLLTTCLPSVFQRYWALDFVDVPAVVFMHFLVSLLCSTYLPVMFPSVLVPVLTFEKVLVLVPVPTFEKLWFRFRFRFQLHI